MAKEDEFYTQMRDIEKEMIHYAQEDHFRGKVIYCNADNPEKSNFWKYFRDNFKAFGLKKLISTHYKIDEPVYILEYDGVRSVRTGLLGNGDFRSDECIAYLKQADVVVTNPPFSLFREYMAQLIEYDKEFIVIGNLNAVTYKEIFPLLKSGEVWTGNSYGDMSFRVPSYYEPRKTRFWVDKSGQKWRSMGNIYWFTNLDTPKRHEDIVLSKEYDPDVYLAYDNYDAINVGKVADIPKGYDGAMGVPITFIGKHNPKQFEIIKFRKGNDGKDLKINGKSPYFRILIRAVN